MQQRTPKISPIRTRNAPSRDSEKKTEDVPHEIPTVPKVSHLAPIVIEQQGNRAHIITENTEAQYHGKHRGTVPRTTYNRMRASHSSSCPD